MSEMMRQNCGCGSIDSEQSKLFSWLNMCSFAVTDIVLYLDTHPDDEEALEYFNHFSTMRNQALEKYASMYGPLSVDTAAPAKQWDYAEMKWPWEGGIA
jgi:spore coat protein JB